MLDAMRALKELSAAENDQSQGGQQVRLVIDRDAASRLGVTPTDIDAALYNAFGQRQIAIVYTEVDQFRVVLEVDPRLQDDPETLNSIYIRPQRGGAQVP